MQSLSLNNVHPTWKPIVSKSLEQMDAYYIEQLSKNPNWLPGCDKIFNAFALPLPKVKYILLGESPYPRAESANGYAFWDAKVTELWSPQGLSKNVNKATSLRNIMKMLLVAENILPAANTSQEAIAALDKSLLINTIGDLFTNLQKKGVLLLNATLVLGTQSVSKEAKAWKPFMASLMQQIAAQKQNNITLILLGRIAKAIDVLDVSKQFARFYAEHPYNISFITNPDVINLFAPMNLLKRK